MPRTTTKIDQEDTFDVTILALTGNASIGVNIITVVVAGTPRQLPSNSSKRVTVQAFYSNSDYVAVGNSTIDVTTKRGIILPPLSTHTFTVQNTDMLYVDASTVGPGISFVYEN